MQISYTTVVVVYTQPMSDAHWHLILTHIPILGVPAGLALLVWGLLKKSADLRTAALVAFILCAVFAFLAKQTGEGAEEQIEHFPGFSKTLVHEHEEMAEKASLLTGILGVTSFVLLIAHQRGRELPKATYPVVVALALTCSGVLAYTGALGGPISHSEIRGDALTPGVPAQASQVEREED